MTLKRVGIIFLPGLAVLAVIIALLFLPRAVEADPTRAAVRFFGLYGYLFLSVATLTTPFLKEITQAFGKPFLKVHHSFSILGIVFITLHPVFNAIEHSASPSLCPISIHGTAYGYWQADPPSSLNIRPYADALQP